jgi:hypothetical protein
MFPPQAYVSLVVLMKKLGFEKDLKEIIQKIKEARSSIISLP